MDKFKDFLYNKNDIIVALVILLVALGIIFFRISAIMDYPKALAEEQAKAIQKVQEENNKSEEAQDKSANNTDDSKDDASSEDDKTE